MQAHGIPSQPSFWTTEQCPHGVQERFAPTRVSEAIAPSSGAENAWEAAEGAHPCLSLPFGKPVEALREPTSRGMPSETLVAVPSPPCLGLFLVSAAEGNIDARSAVPPLVERGGRLDFQLWGSQLELPCELALGEGEELLLRMSIRHQDCHHLAVPLHLVDVEHQILIELAHFAWNLIILCMQNNTPLELVPPSAPKTGGIDERTFKRNISDGRG